MLSCHSCGKLESTYGIGITPKCSSTLQQSPLAYRLWLQQPLIGFAVRYPFQSAVLAALLSS